MQDQKDTDVIGGFIIWAIVGMIIGGAILSFSK